MSGSVIVTELVKALRESDAFGVLIELGYGAAVAQNIHNVPGASRTILASEQPYDQKVCAMRFGETSTSIRSVSREMCEHVLTSAINAKEYQHDKRTLGFVSTFQVGDIDKKDVRTHGWFGVAYKSRRPAYYHVSFYGNNLNRVDLISSIGQCGLALIALHALPEKKLLVHHLLAIQPFTVDIVHDAFDDAMMEMDPLEFLCERMASGGSDSIICFTPDRKFVRLEDVMRGKKTVVVLKGSFNPPTIEHERLLRTSQSFNGEAEEEIARVFMISINTVDKGVVQNLRDRLDYISAMGVSCLINLRGRFKDTHQTLLSAFYGIRFLFSMGQDTYDRIEHELINCSNFNFQIFPRTKCSSTRVRELLSIREPTDQDKAELKSLLPQKVLAHLRSNHYH